MTEKRCTKCGEVKSIDEFSKCKNRKDGYRAECKSCVSSYNKKYREDNSERLAVQKREYAKANRDRINEYKKQWVQENKEHRREYMRQWRQENRKQNNYDYVTEKECSKCGEIKLISEFNKHVNARDGHTEQCRSCISEQSRKKYEENPEQAKERARRYREENPEKVKEQKRKERENNLDRYQEYLRQYYQENQETIKERSRKHYEENTERHQECARQWRKENIGKKRSYEAKRRALEKSTSTTDPWELQQIALFYKDCPKGRHVDHILPLALGGCHELSNLQHLKNRLNESKGAKHPDEWDDPRPISCRA